MASRPPDERLRAAPPTRQETARFAVINVVRLSGVALTILGLLIAQGVIDLAGDQNRLVGYAVIATGLIEVFVVPLVLSRRWRTPRS